MRIMTINRRVCFILALISSTAFEFKLKLSKMSKLKFKISHIFIQHSACVKPYLDPKNTLVHKTDNCLASWNYILVRRTENQKIL